ncbi:hypothetical protein HBH77_120230 [Parastagonospora nodorum]|nr:hypothetical protein HBI78_188260 [Parastagonospora nodorum]KAH5105613.1 hypothetical protein HBH71_205120 [Parastagonospora nodorum]KAH5202536.1 hypothetical protein HBH77_120230 [Parastagonospora nodorum]
MEIVLSIILQALLIFLAFATTLVRSCIRLRIERRSFTLPDYFVWAGWLCSLGWFICSVLALRLQINHPLAEPDQTTDSVDYLVIVFISSYFFDIGLYFPKAALIAFYGWLIPHGFRNLQLAIYASCIYMTCAFVATLLTDTLTCLPVSDNWSIVQQSSSLWNTYEALAINWSLNWSTDLFLFILPFFLLRYLKLHKRQKMALCGVFSLGLITIVISLVRFIVYTVPGDYSLEDASGDLWCTAEMSIAIIVVSLPALKVLIMRSVPSTANCSTDGHFQSESRKHMEAYIPRSLGGSFEKACGPKFWQFNTDADPNDEHGV